MRKPLPVLWWLALLAGLPAGALLLVKWHDDHSFYFSLLMMGVYFVQAIYHLVQTIRMSSRHLTRKAAGHVVGLLVSAGLLWAMLWVWGLHWAGTSTNPPTR